MSRLIAESVLIDKLSNLNSKSEWRNNRVSRLVVETIERKKYVVERRLKQEKEKWLLNKKVEELEMKMKRILEGDAENNINTTTVDEVEVHDKNKTPEIKLIPCKKRK